MPSEGPLRNILIVTPKSPVHRSGNRVSANRWRQVFEDLGHSVQVATEADEDGISNADLLIALHARKSASSILRFSEIRPEGKIVVALTGTDLYQDTPNHPACERSLEIADLIITLHRLAVRDLPNRFREKARAIHQSVTLDRAYPKPPESSGIFSVSLIGHLREVKDPLRTARAARLLPETSRIEIFHAGGLHDTAIAEEVRREEQENPRYHWLGEKPKDETFSLIAKSDAMCLTSKMEGGANVIGEAVTLATPVLTTCIPGALGLLGSDYPGTFPVGDTDGLAKLLYRAETDSAFLSDLRQRCTTLKPLFEPEREKNAWECALKELDR